MIKTEITIFVVVAKSLNNGVYERHTVKACYPVIGLFYLDLETRGH